MNEPETLWQIGKPGDGAKEILTKGAWVEEYDYTIGSDADSINNPSIPRILAVPEPTKPSKGMSTDKLNIDFTLERDYGQGQLTLFYNFYGSQEDSLFLDEQLLTKIAGVGEGKLKENEIPLGALGVGKHRLSITTSEGKNGKHAIDYLKLQATVIPSQPATAPPNVVKFDDTFYLKHATGQYLIAIDRGRYNFPQLGNTGKVTLQLVGKKGEVVTSQSRIKIRTTESVTANNNILGAFANSHNCYYWQDGYDEDKQSWLIAKVSGEAGSICYEDRVYLTNCSYNDQKLCADTNYPGYITTAKNTQDWWILESVAPSPSVPTQQSEPETLWQIGKPGDGAKEILTKGAWVEEYDYTIGSDADSINNPSIPRILTVPEPTKPSKGMSTDKLNIDFTLERDYGQGQLTLFYNFYGSQEDSLFLDEQLLTKIAGVGEGKLKENEIPLGVLGVGKHRLSITTSEGKDGKHAIDYLKLQATVPISIQQDRKDPAMTDNIQSVQTQSVLTFDGQDDYVQLAYQSHFDLTNNFTIEAWVKTNKLDSVQRIFTKPSAHSFGLTGKQIRFTTYDIRDYDTTQANLTVDTWYHLAVALDSDDDAYFYVNGELIEIVLGNVPANISKDAGEIGRGGDRYKEYWNGQISEVRFWGKVRTQEEIKANMSRRLVGNEQGLMGYWPLAKGDGDVVFDKTPNAQNGKIYGNATWQESEIPIAPLKVVKPVALKTTLQPVLVFDSPDDDVCIDSTTAKLTGNFTIEAWVNPTYEPSSTTGGDTTDLGMWVIYAESDNILYLEGNELKFQKNAPHETISSSNGGITLNEWNHIAVVRAGNKNGETKLYINGVQNDNQTAIPAINYDFAKTRIGGQADFPNRFFRGKISELRLWNYPRSQGDIQKDMYHRLRGDEPGLTDYFPLSEGSGILAKDRTSNPNNGKINNASWSRSLIPIVDEVSAIERLTQSTGLEDYGYWWKKVADGLLPEETKIPFRRGRIWR